MNLSIIVKVSYQCELNTIDDQRTKEQMSIIISEQANYEHMPHTNNKFETHESL